MTAITFFPNLYDFDMVLLIKLLYSHVDIITASMVNRSKQQLTFAAINQVNNKNNYIHL